MQRGFKHLTDFLLAQGAEQVGHTDKTYLAHVIGVYRDMEAAGCTEEVCQAGMFHSIYGTERFQRFALPRERRPEVAALIGERAERLAYLNCAVDRASFDRAVQSGKAPYRILDRFTGEEIDVTEVDLEDLCRVHLFDWLEQVPRSRQWDYRREAYHRMAGQLGGVALESYNRVFAAESVAG